MGHIFRYLICAVFLFLLPFIRTETFNVKIGSEKPVNVVDSRFLSFTLDPKYLFSHSDKYNRFSLAPELKANFNFSKESICMASSLTPAYIRIAGPSTSLMSFHNSTITLNGKRKGTFEVTYNQWKKFIHWAKSTGFDLVFALNNNQKTSSGLWDPNMALNILTVAEKARVGDIFWQLGYECTNQSIEDYLNDLETLRVIIESFPQGEQWKVVGGDVTKCLQVDSKSDFKDYVALSNEMMDALMLNGNSSSQELERMSEPDRYKLLQLLSHSSTPLWLTETSHPGGELYRAADWMTSLGYSARNGFSVHYRELVEDEIYEPTLSFYMALLFKNLVGERVLSVDLEAPSAALFAHCTSLRNKPIHGAVTLYGANMDDEPARFSLKLSKREEGGDILQFILSHDQRGNIVVNGRTMYYEGDIKPAVRRIRAYKTLLINLPPKSFGFWVLASTKIEACQGIKDLKEYLQAEVTENSKINDSENSTRTKREIDFDDYEELLETSDDFSDDFDNEPLQRRIDDLNDGLKNVRKFFTKSKQNTINHRFKRQLIDKISNDIEERKFKILRTLKSRINSLRTNEPKPKDNLIKKLIGIARFNVTKILKPDTVKSNPRIQKNYMSKRHLHKKTNQHECVDAKDKLKRTRRSILHKNDVKVPEKLKEYSFENEVESMDEETENLRQIIKKINKDLHNLKLEMTESDNSNIDNSNSDSIVVKSKLTDNGPMIEFSDNDNGLVKSTVENVLSVFYDLNNSLRKFWKALDILE